MISSGPLNSPWGITIAPSGFGEFSNDLLVGNSGDGRINAFDPATGALLGTLQDASATPIVIDGLWALKVRSGGPSVNPNAVYFTAGINDQANGLFGSLTAIPEPGTLTLTMMGVTMLAMRLLILGRSNATC